MKIEQFKKVFYSQVNLYSLLDSYADMGFDFTEFSPALIEAAEDVFNTYLEAYFPQEIIDFINWHLYKIDRDMPTTYLTGNYFIDICSDEEFFTVLNNMLNGDMEFILSVEEYFIGKAVHTFVIKESSVEKAAAKVLEYYSQGELHERADVLGEVEYFDEISSETNFKSTIDIYDKKGNLILTNE